MPASKKDAISAPLGEDGKPMSFQQAMSRLEAIVASLNNPSLELEQAMADFKEGLQISRFCQSQLDHFQNEMNQLVEQSGENHA